MGLSSAVIGSGARVTVVAPANNAHGICKAFMKSFFLRYHCSPNKSNVAHL